MHNVHRAKLHDMLCCVQASQITPIIILIPHRECQEKLNSINNFAVRFNIAISGTFTHYIKTKDSTKFRTRLCNNRLSLITIANLYRRLTLYRAYSVAASERVQYKCSPTRTMSYSACKCSIPYSGRSSNCHETHILILAMLLILFDALSLSIRCDGEQ